MGETKKMRTLEERKAAMLADIAKLEAKELDGYHKERTAKLERQAKVDELVKKYTAEASALDTRIAELNTLIDELEDSNVEDEPVSSVALDEV